MVFIGERIEEDDELTLYTMVTPEAEPTAV